MKEQLSLTREHILHVHQQILTELSKEKRLTETRNKAVALMTEEILLLYMDGLGENASFSAELRRNKGGRIITLRIPGREMDPNQNHKAYNYRYLMKYAQDLPVWSYEDGCNVILLAVPCSDSLINVLSFCWKYASGIRLRLVLGFIIQAVGAYFNFRISYYVAQLIIQYTNNAVSQATAMAVAVFAFVMLEEFSICASDLLYEQVSRQIYSRVQNDLVKKFLDIQSFSITSHGNNVFIRRITDDAETLSDGLSSVSSLNVQVASYIGTMVAVFSISPMVFIYELIILAALFLAQTWRVKAVSKLMISFKEANEKYYGFLTELVQGFHDIRALNLKKQLLRETDTRLRRLVESSDIMFAPVVFLNCRSMSARVASSQSMSTSDIVPSDISPFICGLFAAMAESSSSRSISSVPSSCSEVEASSVALVWPPSMAVGSCASVAASINANSVAKMLFILRSPWCLISRCPLTSCLQWSLRVCAQALPCPFR